MENGLSLADIRAATENDNGFGGNAWVLIILFALIFGNGGFGFGGGNNATNQEILYGQQFQNLGSMVNKIGDGLSSLGYSQLQQMDANTAAINGNIVNEGRAIQTQLCAINSNIDNKFAALEKSQLEQRIAEQAQQINQLNMAQQMANVVRYPNGWTYNAGTSPFCGGNICCN